MILPKNSDLLPVIFGAEFDAIKKDRDWIEAEFYQCSQDPWYFIVNYCWTVRRDDEGMSHVERVPPLEYLRLMANDWFEHLLYLLSKSRQLMATWLMIILHLWKCMFEENFFVVCQTKKEDDADTEMIQRARFVWTNLPGWFKKRCPARYSYCKEEFKKTNSKMVGIPQGADQIRSHNPNCLLSDEFAFQQQAEEAYTAALACCNKITLVSSANPGFMKDLVRDKIRSGL